METKAFEKQKPEKTKPESTVHSARGEYGHLPFRTAAVLGAGTMGAQIAAVLANAGLQVQLLDIASPEENRNSVVEKGFKQAQRAKPDPFFSKEIHHRISLGNFDEHFDRIGDVDWVIEAVVEKMEIKRQVLERVEKTARKDAVISTNTSGLPIGELAGGRSNDFRRRFLGTHFFNPPRYLKLLELIPTPDTDADIVARVAHFGRVHLGKGIVIAKDRPYFIGNRIGVYGMMRAMQAFSSGDYTIEEIDTLTGPLVGRPRSATFRTADLVGLDVLSHVAQNLYEKVAEDENRDVYQVPPILQKLLQNGALGEKAKAGFYKKEGDTILSINPQNGSYESPKASRLGDIDRISKESDLDRRLNLLFEDPGPAGQFFRNTTLDLLGYSARRIPEISDNPADIDRAIRWGFGWEKGPFEIWDTLGMEAVLNGMEERNITIPDWIREMKRAGIDRFYRTLHGERQVYLPDKGYTGERSRIDEIPLAAVKTKESRWLWQNEEAALLDLGEGVALYEFRSKANSLGRNVMQGLAEVIERVEQDVNLRGLVIGNEGKNFSAGANVVEMATAAMQGRFDLIEQFLKGFQDTIQRVYYAAKPVVVAVHQRVLGGGCEMVMACPHPVADAESYIGLVELGIGLIPAGTGSMRLAALASERAPHGYPSEIQPFLQMFFENAAMAKVSSSAVQAQSMGYLPDAARIVMNSDRRLFVAKEEVIRLSTEGYLPPPVKTRIKVLGNPTRAAFEVALDQYRFGNFISEYDQYLATKLAYVITGGTLTAPQEVHENYLLELEREVFLRLLGEKKTQARIEHLLKTGKPLRN